MMPHTACMLAIGVVGENGSGKGSFVSLLIEHSSQRVEVFKSSAFLLETLRLWNIEATRANLQALAFVMEREFGEGLLAKAVVARMQGSSADIVVFDGVRWQSQIDALKAAFDHVVIVYVTADADIRFERLRKRHEKANEAGMSYEQFLLEEQAPTEIEIPLIARQAHYTINTNGGLDELRENVQMFYNGHIASARSSGITEQ